MMESREKYLIATCAITSLLLLFDVFLADDEIYNDPPMEAIMEMVGVLICTVLCTTAILYRKDERISTMLYSCGIAVYCILSDMVIDIARSSVFFYLIIADLVGMLSIPCLIGFWFGYRHNIRRLRNFTVIGILASLLPWIVDNPTHISIFDQSLLYYLPSIFALLAYVVYTARPEVNDVPPTKQLVKHMTRIESRMIMSETSYMTKEDVEMILGISEDGWNHYEGGPVEKSCCATIIGGTRRKWYVTVRKYRGEEFFRAIMSPTKDTRGDYGFPFDIVHYHFHTLDEDNIVRIYGHNGIFIELYVDNPNTGKENTVSRQFDKLLRGF